jgi:hypothetical protein
MLSAGFEPQDIGYFKLRLTTWPHKTNLDECEEDDESEGSAPAANSSPGTVGVFHDDNVHPKCYGFEPLQGDGPNGKSNFGFLATQSDADEQILFSTTDIDSSHRDSMVEDIESF